MSYEHNAERSKRIIKAMIDLESRNPLTWRSVGSVCMFSYVGRRQLLISPEFYIVRSRYK